MKYTAKGHAICTHWKLFTISLKVNFSPAFLTHTPFQPITFFKNYSVVIMSYTCNCSKCERKYEKMFRFWLIWQSTIKWLYPVLWHQLPPFRRLAIPLILIPSHLCVFSDGLHSKQFFFKIIYIYRERERNVDFNTHRPQPGHRAGSFKASPVPWSQVRYFCRFGRGMTVKKEGSTANRLE